MELSREICPEYNALLDVHKELCRALPINDLFPSLITLRVINIDDKERLCLGKIERDRTEEFIEKHLLRQLAVGETEKFYNFMTALEESEKGKFLIPRVRERIAHHQNKVTDEDRCTVYSDGSTQKSCVNKRSTKENNYAAMIVCFSFLSTFVCIAFTIIWCHPLVKENEQLRNQVIMLQSHISSNFTQQILYPTPPAYDIKDHDHLLPGTAQYNNTEILLQNYSVAPALIVMFDLTEKIANEEKWKSEPFFAFEKGYLMYLSVYPGGHDDGKGSHVSVYLHLMKGPYDDELEQSGYWPMRGTFSIGLLDVDNHGYYFTINYFVCELCTFRVKEGSEAPSGLGFPEYISHKSLPIYNKYDSLGFLISYRNRPEEAITSMIPIFQNRLRLLIDNFIKCLSHLWPVIVIPVAMDLLFKYDVVYCLQTIIFPLVKDQIMTVMAMEILLGADLMLAMLAKYTNVDDSVYAPLHCVFVRLVIISAGTYLASIINFVVSLLLLLSEYL